MQPCWPSSTYTLHRFVLRRLGVGPCCYISGCHEQSASCCLDLRTLQGCSVHNRHFLSTLPILQRYLHVDRQSMHHHPEESTSHPKGRFELSGQVLPFPPYLSLIHNAVMQQLYDASKHTVVTAASCTTNCLAPVVKVVHEKLKIKHGCITTVHAVTNTQTIMDAPNSKKADLRRARSGLMNLAPTSTGSATAITKIFPELTGKLNGACLLSDCAVVCYIDRDAQGIAG